jgi:hypothetical protein
MGPLLERLIWFGSNGSIMPWLAAMRRIHLSDLIPILFFHRQDAKSAKNNGNSTKKIREVLGVLGALAV